MKTVAKLLLAASLCLAPMAKAQDYTVARTAAEAKVQLWDWSPRAEHQAAAVRLRCGASGGSGVCVWSNGDTVVVLTAAHVVDPPMATTIHWQDGRTVQAKIIGIDRRNDIAVLQANFKGKVTTIPVAAQSPPEGARIEILGFGGPRTSLRRFLGKVIKTGDRVESQAYLLSGDSGAAMVYRGTVVGIISGGPYLSEGVIDARGQRWPLVHPAGGSGCRPIASLVGRCAPFCFPERSSASSDAYPDSPDNPPGPVRDAVDYERLAEVLIEKIAADERFRGAPGKDGVNGKPGKDSAPLELDLDDLSREVDKRLPPLTIQIVDRDGKVLSSASRRLGEKLQILFQPKENK
tara:strand:+ start:5610 stop:6656 length:1047 start_codon:yes stop_codon:yes gene_type:complete